MYFPLTCPAGNQPHVKFPQPAPCSSSLFSPLAFHTAKVYPARTCVGWPTTYGLRKESKFSILISSLLIIVNVSVRSIAVGTGSKWFHPDRGWWKPSGMVRSSSRAGAVTHEVGLATVQTLFCESAVGLKSCISNKLPGGGAAESPWQEWLFTLFQPFSEAFSLPY